MERKCTFSRSSESLTDSKMSGQDTILPRDVATEVLKEHQAAFDKLAQELN